MNIRKKTFIGLVSAIVLILSSSSYARCTQGDLTGVWILSGSSGTFTGWDFCKVKIRSTGKIAASNSGCLRVTPLDSGEIDITSGKLELSSNCTYQGGIKFCNGDNCEKMAVIGRLDKGKTVMVGGSFNSAGDVVT